MNDIPRYGVIGLFFLLIGSGSTLLLDQGELEHAYVCDMTQELGIFYGGVSGTAYSGYPYKENRTGAEVCKHPDSGVKGKWVACDEYASRSGKTCAEQVAQSSGVQGAPVIMRQEITDRYGNHIFVVCTEEGRYKDEGVRG